MAKLPERGIRDRDDLARFEAEMPLEERLPERSVLDVFVGSAARLPDRTALTMLMTGAPDEQPRRVSYAELLGLVRRAANLFATLGGSRPGGRSAPASIRSTFRRGLPERRLANTQPALPAPTMITSKVPSFISSP